MPAYITIRQLGRAIEVARGETILDAALRRLGARAEDCHADAFYAEAGKARAAPAP